LGATTHATAALHQAVAIQHRMDGTFGRDGNTREPAQQALTDFASTPAGVLVLYVRSSCRWAASRTEGAQWPTLIQPMPPEKSSNVFPSTSHSEAPSALAMKTGTEECGPRGTACWRRSIHRRDCGPGIDVWRRIVLTSYFPKEQKNPGGHSNAPVPPGFVRRVSLGRVGSHAGQTRLSTAQRSGCPSFHPD
jgi:hypothetical protein